MKEPTPSGGGGEAPSGADLVEGVFQGREPLLTNLRAEREWLWLRARFSPFQLVAAIAALGTQRPYPLNIARKLRVSLPDEVDLPFTDAQKRRNLQVARENLDSVRSILRGK